MKRFWHVLRILFVLSMVLLPLSNTAALAQGDDPPDPTPPEPMALDIKVEADANSAIISWQTAEPQTGWVEWGASEDQMTSLAYDQRGQDVVDTYHQVDIGGLEPGKEYYYLVITSAEGIDNIGQLFQFSTKDETISAPDSPAADPIYNTAFLTNAQLEDYTSMTVDQVRALFQANSGYFRQAVTDVDGQTFDASTIIVQAANQYRISPKVILATLEKEHIGVTRTTRPSDAQMRFLMGCVSSTTPRQQLTCAAERFRAYQNQQADGDSTVSGWRVGSAKVTQDGVTVTPATKAVAGQFTYTPYAGRQWGGNNPAWGGVYLFYAAWNRFRFGGNSGGPAGYSFCANENQRCSFSGTKDVAYGANGRFNYRYNISGGIDCNNNVFGDPIPGTVKACYTRASSCTDAAAFVGQSVYPTVSPGQGFQIYFEVRNTGTCTWRQGDNYYLGNVNSTPLGANARQDLGGDVPPNSVKRWTMNMTAPGAPGNYRTQWMVKHGDATFGPNMYIDVTVTGASCPTITAWKGEYWNNKDLAGNPILCRNDANVNFDWGTGGPGGGVLNDGFSARWTRDLSFTGGRYRFHLAGDDGIRLWLDGNLVIDQWKDQGRTEYTSDRDLGAGNHNLRVQYYENGGGANVALWWDYLGGGPAGYSFCANENQRCSFSGTKDVAYGANGRFNYRYNISGGIDCNNNVFGDPIPGTVKACYTRASSCTDAAAFVGQSVYPTVSPGQGFQIYFEVRNTGTCTWRQGDNYYLGNVNSTPLGANARQDLGGDVPPNGAKRWTMNMTAPGAPGNYRTQWMVKHGDATFGPNMYIDVTVTGASCPTITAWKGEYWNNKDLAGNPILCRNDANVNFDWGTGGPGGGVLNDGFSARWTRDLSFTGGRYRFHLAGDDGIRLWLDGNLVIDQWKDQGRTEYTSDRDLGAGNHNLRVQYYENGGGANVALWWDYLGGGDSGNIAANKSSWATSQESSSYPPRNGNDGNTGSRWSSRISSTLGDEWWWVDLGTQNFNQVVIRWEAAYAGQHFVGWSNDGANFTGYWYTIAAPGSYRYDLGSRTARFAGILMRTRAPRMQNYSFWEFEVYNRTALTGEEVLEPLLESPIPMDLPRQLPEMESPPNPE